MCCHPIELSGVTILFIVLVDSGLADTFTESLGETRDETFTSRPIRFDTRNS